MARVVVGIDPMNGCTFYELVGKCNVGLQILISIVSPRKNVWSKVKVYIPIQRYNHTNVNI